MHFTKDNITNNTAAATVRQVVTVVFERVVAEDEHYKGGYVFVLQLKYYITFGTSKSLFAVSRWSPI